MGIPGSASIFRQTAKGPKGKEVPIPLPSKAAMDNMQTLQIDANALAHASKTRVYGEHMNGVRSAENLERHAEGVVVDLLMRVKKFKPKSVLHIAWDGTPVGGKINQQRSRRINNVPINDAAIDPNIITSGTRYMHDLEARIESLLQDPRYAAVLPPQIVIDPSSNPGEGEHKIADFLREWKNRDWTDDEQDKATGAHVIDGADGDLVMISLMVGMPNVWLHRAAESGKYGCVESSSSYEHLLKVTKKMVGEEDPTKAAAKLVAMWSVLGNDFMPALPGVIVWKASVDRLSKIITENELELVYLDEDTGLYRLDYDSYLAYMAWIEDEMQAFIDDNTDRKRRQSDRALHPIMKKSTDYRRFKKAWPTVFAPAAYGDFDAAPIQSEWALDKEEMAEARMTKAARDYLVTADWMLVYYQTGIQGITMGDRQTLKVDPYWYYPYQYAPTAGFIAENALGPYEETEGGTVYEDESIQYTDGGNIIGRDVTEKASHIDGVFTGLHQLMISLPQTSKGLLPSGAQTWMEAESLIGDIYPRFIRSVAANEDGASHLDIKEINMPSMRRINEYIGYMNREPKDIDSTRFDPGTPTVIENNLAYTSDAAIEHVKAKPKRMKLDMNESTQDEAAAYLAANTSRGRRGGRRGGKKAPAKEAKEAPKTSSRTPKTYSTERRVRGAQKTSLGRGRGGRGGGSSRGRRGAPTGGQGIYAGSAMI